jgi:N-methylhydantoinase B
MQHTALVCTHGFADVLTLGRQNRADPYALHVGESPWVSALPDAWRVEVPGRINATGQEVTPLDLPALLARLSALPHAPTHVAVCLLHATRNPAHEQQVRAAVQARWPGMALTCSHDVPADGEHAGEFERTVATLRAAGLALPARPASHNTAATGLAAQLESLANAMQACLVAQAVSSVVREAMDCAAAIFLPDGRMLAQARSLPLLLGSLSPAVAGLLEVFPAQTMQPDDGYLSNDPWAGGTHLPDLVLLRPVHVNGAVRALVACILHHQDVGGITPGSVPTDATSIQQEGLRIAPVQLYCRGQADANLMRLLRANSRMPDNLTGDLAAQWAALAAGAQALQPLLEQTGFDAAAQALIAGSEAATRAALRAVPDGEWQFADALDGDGISPEPVPLEVVLRKRGDTLQIDLRGCAAQTRGPVNASRGAVWAAVTYFARMLAPRADSNHGCTAPVALLTQPGTIVNPAFPAAVNARTNLVKLLANALLGAWAQASPGQLPAPNAGVAVVLSLSGESAGRRWVFTEIIASAAGGAPWGPGGSGVSTDVGNARNTPAEVIESQAPLRVQRIALRRGSGGAGTHAGGCGVVRAYQLLEGSGLVSYRGERHTIAPQGAAGGLSGACGTARIERADGTTQVLTAKARAHWQAGDVLVIETAGGGGWGKPAPAGADFA